MNAAVYKENAIFHPRLQIQTKCMLNLPSFFFKDSIGSSTFRQDSKVRLKYEKSTI